MWGARELEGGGGSWGCVTWDAEADDDDSKEGGAQPGSPIDLRRQHQAEQILWHVREREGAHDAHAGVEER